MRALPELDSIQRILIIKWSAMGDVVIATSAFEDIRKAFPNSEIHLNTLPPWDQLFENDPRFSQIIKIDLRSKGRNLASSWEWLKVVRGYRYDLIVDFQSTDRSRILMSLMQLMGASAPHRLGYHRRFPYSIAPPPLPKPTHAQDYLKAALKEAGIPIVTQRPVLYPHPHQRQHALQLLNQHGVKAGNYAVLLPGCQATGFLKRWGVPRFAELAIRLHDGGLEKIVLLGSKDELDECRAIEQLCGQWVVNLCDMTEILEVLPICSKARFIIANDTGTAHIASATGKPMVVICGPTDPLRVKPMGDNVVALQSDIYCVNCYRKQCVHHSCMLLVSPDQVLDSLSRLSGFKV